MARLRSSSVSASFVKSITSVVESERSSVARIDLSYRRLQRRTYLCYYQPSPDQRLVGALMEEHTLGCLERPIRMNWIDSLVLGMARPRLKNLVR